MTPRPDAAEILRTVDWHVLRRLDGLLQGDHRTAHLGSGTDLSDLRPYRPDDDVRHIDWNVTARSGEPHVRQFIEDRELTVWFLIDRSESMTVQVDGRSKEGVATSFVASVATMMNRQGNRVGAILWNEGLDAVVEPGSGRLHLLRLVDQLAAPPSHPGVTTSLDGLFSIASSRMRRRSLVFVLSDFLVEPGWERELTHLARRHEIVVIQCDDPRESELPSAGMVLIEDVETGDQILVDTDDPGFRERYEALHQERSASFAEAVRKAGADPHELRVDVDVVDTIRSMIRDRMIRRRSAPVARGTAG